jgi:hypothetical protein
MLDPLIGVRELPVEGAHEGEERGDHRAQATRQGKLWTRQSSPPSRTARGSRAGGARRG